MDEDEIYRVEYDEPRYEAASEIDPSALYRALCNLNLLGDDPFLRMQAFNLAIIDQWLTEIEYKVLLKLIDEERTPFPDSAFLSAQSQMWIFAAYELLRTWQERAKDMIKWFGNGGLESKLTALEKEQGYRHFGRECRASQIKSMIADPSRIIAIQRDLKRTHIPFVRLEALRISLAKHQVRHKKNSVALDPGYGRINFRCGALDYELENGVYSMGNINRRDVAEEIRALLADDYVPSDEDIASFDEFMRGPANSPFKQ